jgi:hypothetical protein
MNKKMLKLVFASIVFMLSLSCYSQNIATDRPDQTESSSTIKGNNFQIESGILIGYTEADSKSQRQLLAPTTLFRIGITKCLELRILSQFESISDERSSTNIDGISDLEIGTKIQLLQDPTVNTEIALLSHLIIPTGSSKLSLGHYGTINKLCISHVITESVGIGYNVGYNYSGLGDGDITYSLAIGFSITDKVGLYMEAYGELADLQHHISNFDAGFTYLMQDHIQADFSFGTGVNHHMNYLSLGISILFR